MPVNETMCYVIPGDLFVDFERFCLVVAVNLSNRFQLDGFVEWKDGARS